MAQINIPESVGRALYNTFAERKVDFLVVNMLDEKSNDVLSHYLQDTISYVVKPDYTISKRGKNNLLGINLSKNEVINFIRKNNGSKYQQYELNRFIIMPYVSHEKEYYISFSTQEENDMLQFSLIGGVDIEENWDKVTTMEINILEPSFLTLLENADLGLSAGELKYLIPIINSLYNFFKEYGFTFLEINPFILINNFFVPLDIKGRLDDCSFFSLQQKVSIYSMLDTVNEQKSYEENYIAKLDSLTGASLKLQVINKNGRIWPMISGGGASIIYFDGLVAKGYLHEIAFYGEYSGNPSEELTYEYAKTIIEMMLTSSAREKVFLIAGANANFTDIALTFKGIILAIEERVNEIKAQDIQILIRRGGPNVKAAFKQMKQLSDKYHLSIVLENTDFDLLHILNFIT